jgi:hypothetical protein
MGKNRITTLFHMVDQIYISHLEFAHPSLRARDYPNPLPNPAYSNPCKGFIPAAGY